MKSYGVTIQMKATEHLCGTVYYAVQGGSMSMDKILRCDHSNESY